MIGKEKMLALLLSLIIFDVDKVTAVMQFKIVKVQSKICKTEKIERMEDLEYPRNDDCILTVLFRMWENYYACLIEKENKETKPEIRRLLEGQNTELKCDFCERPFQNYQEFQWKYKPLSKEMNITELQQLDLTPEMSLTKNTLHIYNVIKKFAGLYVCFHGKSVMSIYILEVSNNDTAVQVKKINPKSEKFNQYGQNFYVRYHWTNFTECSECGKVGKKFKYGVCHVSLTNFYKENHPHNIIRNPIIPHLSKQNYSSKNTKNPRLPYVYTQNYASKIMKNLRTIRCLKDSSSNKTNTSCKKETLKKNTSTSSVYDKSTEMEIINRFRNGIPCRSPYLIKMNYEFLRKFPAVKVIQHYCWESCDEQTFFEVIDEKENIVEIANNSEGIYSLLQELPNVPLGVERTTVVGQFGSDIILHCPGTARTNTPVSWMVSDKKIHSQVINAVSNGRFTEDFTQRLHIKRLRLKDSKIYSCWQKGRLVGTVHLSVDKKFENGYNHHVILVFMALMVGMLLFLGTKILTRELKMREK